MIRIASAALLASGLTLAACSSDAPPPPEPVENESFEAPLPPPEPVAEPVNIADPAPAENVAVAAEPLPEPSVDEQTMEDAEATGMTARRQAETEETPAESEQ